MKRNSYAITELLPHQPPMILLDDLISYNETAAVALVMISEASLFRAGDGVPVHVGLEYMAQTCGAHAGAIARDQGQPVRIGLLLGTRQYRAHVPGFRLGDRLTVTVRVLYTDEQMGAFDCRIERDGELAAEARLNVYQPSPAELSAVGGGAP